MPRHFHTGRRRLPLPSGVFRRVRLDERAAVEAHFLRLGPQERRWRFQGLTSEASLLRHAAILTKPGPVVIGFFCDGVLRGLAELHPLEGGSAGEAAFTVEGDWQKRGIGTELMRQSLEAAWRRGMRKVIVTCTVSNRMMRDLARGANFEIGVTGDEALGERSLVRAPGAGSLARLLIDVHATAAFAMMDAARNSLAIATRSRPDALPTPPAPEFNTSSGGSGPAVDGHP